VKLYKGKIQGRKPLAIKKYLIDYPNATLDELLEALELNVSRSTLCTYLQRMDWPRNPAKRQILLSARNQAKRLKFCQEMLQWDDEQLGRILWSDETKVKARPNGEIVFYRAPRNHGKYIQHRSTNSPGIMFWGCISRQAYGPLHSVEGTMNGDVYLDLLKRIVVPEIEASPVPLVYQQDNAPCHKRRDVLTFLASQNFQTLEWPAQSPDLSPIEWIWNCIKQKMKARRPRPDTKAKIMAAILDIWDNLEEHTRVSTIDTFRGRLEECVARKGGFTNF
jgi:hypothetical protein